MKRAVCVLLFILTETLLLWAQIKPLETNVKVFTGVNVLPMDRERVLFNQNVVIHDGIIIAIGPAERIKIPKNAEIIQASGKFLMPGLADMHFHLNDASGTILDQTLAALTAAGVTVIRDMNGFPNHLRIRDEINQGKRLGPVIYGAGRITDNQKLRPYFRIVTTPAEARQAVVDDKSAGYDFFKVYSLLSVENYQAIVDEARQLKLPVIGHVPESVGLPGALRSKQRSIEHLFSYCEAARPPGAKDFSDFRELFHAVEIDESRLPSLAQATRRAGTWNTPTLFYAKTRLPFEGARKAWEQPELRALGERNRKLIVQSLHRAGAGILLGTDASASWYLVPGFSVYEELKLLVEAGLTPYQAIRAATADAAKFLESREFGIIAKGKGADLILLDANPLQNIKNLETKRGVMVRGKWFSSETLTRMLSEIQLNPDGTRRR